MSCRGVEAPRAHEGRCCKAFLVYEQGGRDLGYGTQWMTCHYHEQKNELGPGPIFGFTKEMAFVKNYFTDGACMPCENSAADKSAVIISVKIHALNVFPASCQFTALPPSRRPTPITAPVIQCVVDIGKP